MLLILHLTFDKHVQLYYTNIYSVQNSVISPIPPRPLVYIIPFNQAESNSKLQRKQQIINVPNVQVKYWEIVKSTPLTYNPARYLLKTNATLLDLYSSSRYISCALDENETYLKLLDAWNTYIGIPTYTKGVVYELGSFYDPENRYRLRWWWVNQRRLRFIFLHPPVMDGEFIGSEGLWTN